MLWEIISIEKAGINFAENMQHLNEGITKENIVLSNINV